MEYLPFIWACILGIGVTLYVLMDGFSLGIGILFPAARREHRGQMMATVLPVWDGNQTWLVGGGAALFTAFPKAFNLLLGALYLPIIFMVIALVFRGAAFEFRSKATNKRLWDASFAGGATVAAFCQGFILGQYVLGFRLEGEMLVPAVGFNLLFSLATGVAVVLAYALLGACWVVMKAEDELQDWARAMASLLIIPVSLSVLLVSLWTPYLVPEIAERWFSLPNFVFLLPIPLWTTAVVVTLYLGLRRRDWNDALPFISCIGLYLLTLLGLGVSLWPNLVPGVYSFEDVAAPAESLLLVLIGVLFIVPIILAYTAHNYYVFRGKVKAVKPGPSGY